MNDYSGISNRLRDQNHIQLRITIHKLLRILILQSRLTLFKGQQLPVICTSVDYGLPG